VQICEYSAQAKNRDPHSVKLDTWRWGWSKIHLKLLPFIIKIGGPNKSTLEAVPPTISNLLLL
jgi:hypothetical protein